MDSSSAGTGGKHATSGKQCSHAVCSEDSRRALLSVHLLSQAVQALAHFGFAKQACQISMIIRCSSVYDVAGSQKEADIEPQSLRLERSISRAQKIQVDSLQRQLQVCFHSCFAAGLCALVSSSFLPGCHAMQKHSRRRSLFDQLRSAHVRGSC